MAAWDAAQNDQIGGARGGGERRRGRLDSAQPDRVIGERRRRPPEGFLGDAQLALDALAHGHHPLGVDRIVAVVEGQRRDHLGADANQADPKRRARSTAQASLGQLPVPAEHASSSWNRSSPHRLSPLTPLERSVVRTYAARMRTQHRPVPKVQP